MKLKATWLQCREQSSAMPHNACFATCVFASDRETSLYNVLVLHMHTIM